MEKRYTNSGEEFIVIDEYTKHFTYKTTKSRKFTMWLIQYTATGYTTEVYKSNALLGKLKDPYTRSVYGVGYNGVPKTTPYTKQAKQLWCNMMKRCYSVKDPRGYHGVATVDARWANFSTFLEDLPTLEGFDKWLLGQNGGEDKYNLDKDLKFKNNKVYSKYMCSFVTEYLNKSEGAKNGKPFTKKPRQKEVGKV